MSRSVREVNAQPPNNRHRAFAETSDARRYRRNEEEITLLHVQRARLSRYARWCPEPATVLTAIAWRLLLLRVSGSITFALQGPD